MKFYVILENAPESEMDRAKITLPDSADGDAVDNAISNVIDGWMLSIGDTIKIVEAE